jgi:cellulose synthase/poly-beta-1,6-N-acetylglucosamine synthase-like glycosyltransferase
MARPLRAPAPLTAFDLIVATYRRPVFLRRTLISAVSAEIPPELAGVPRCGGGPMIGDRSAAATVAEMTATSPIPVRYLHEPAAGKSSALNRAIVGSSAELVGFVDDDEEIGPQWFVEAATAFAGDVEYVDSRCSAVLVRPRASRCPRLAGAQHPSAAVQPLVRRGAGHVDLLGFQYGRYVYRDLDPIARLAPSLREHAGCSHLPAGAGV